MIREYLQQIGKKLVREWNESIGPTLAILPTALFAGGPGEPYANQDDIFIVPYSDHSSYSGRYISSCLENILAATFKVYSLVIVHCSTGLMLGLSGGAKSGYQVATLFMVAVQNHKSVMNALIFQNYTSL